MIRTVLIGAGNLATHLAKAIENIDEISIVQVYSRTRESAESLAKSINTKWTTSLEEIDSSVDLVIFSVKDDALETIIKKINTGNAICVHTAGSIPIEIFNGICQNYGVLYPLQTFTKSKGIDFSKIPIFVEGSSDEIENRIEYIASKLSDKVRIASSEQRKYLHLAAVFACNFTNHLYAQAASILDQHGLIFEDLIPLIEESVEKIQLIDPRNAQTGPAARGDIGVMQMQKEMLTNETQREIYSLMSESIQRQKEK
ncbi:MAG: Rossmann-like and DUF2520 domain-containing protein [Bacteroidales bacterium]